MDATSSKEGLSINLTSLHQISTPSPIEEGKRELMLLLRGCDAKEGCRKTMIEQ
jgi:hypothetical protein